jgi:hypothetical protein
MGRRIVRLFKKDFTPESIKKLEGIEVNIELTDRSLLNGYLNKFNGDSFQFQTKLKNKRSLLLADINYLDYAT